MEYVYYNTKAKSVDFLSFRFFCANFLGLFRYFANRILIEAERCFGFVPCDFCMDVIGELKRKLYGIAMEMMNNCLYATLISGLLFLLNKNGENDENYMIFVP